MPPAITLKLVPGPPTHTRSSSSISLSLSLFSPVPASGYAAYNGYAHFAAGLACGLSSLSAGLCIGIVGDSGVRASGQHDKLYVPMVLILIFAEALGLYGLIIAIILSSVSKAECTPAP